MVNLIIEGSDCVGKTSIATELEKKGFRRFHFMSPPRELSNTEKRVMYKKLLFLMASYLEHDDNVIFDRYHIGELVYGRYYRKYIAYYIDELELLIKDYAVLVCVTCDDDVLHKRFDGQGMRQKDIKKFNKLFVDYCRKSLLNTIIVDTTRSSPKACAARILKRAKKYDNRR